MRLSDILVLEVRVTGLIRTALAAWGAGTGLVMVLMVIGYVTGGGIG